MQQKFKDVLDPKETQHHELQACSDQLRRDLSRASSQISQLEKEVAYLEWERPDRYIYWKGQFLDLVYYALGKMLHLIEMAKQAFLKWRERRKTHPLY